MAEFVHFGFLFAIVFSFESSDWKKSNLLIFCELGTDLAWLAGDVLGNFADCLGFHSSVRKILIVLSTLSFSFRIIGMILFLLDHEWFNGLILSAGIQTAVKRMANEVHFWQWKDQNERMFAELTVAVEDDIESDAICIICRKEMTAMTARKVGC
jgi:hypothetical protein